MLHLYVVVWRDVCFFCFKQKTAYEMRISDWSSDVCSSDLFEPYNGAKHNNNVQRYLNAVSPIERISTAVFGDYQITDGIQIFGEFLYTHRKSDQLATPGTLRNISISAANPTNPTGQDLLLVRRMLVEGGPREFLQKTETWQGTLGFRGKLANEWAWEVAGALGRNTAEIGRAHV